MNNHLNKNVLITCQGWFLAPDGKQYLGAWGKLTAIHEAGKTLGFIPNRSHANWFIELGPMIIMGCQVMYLIACPNEPELGEVDDFVEKDGEIKIFKRPSKIYKAI